MNAGLHPLDLKLLRDARRLWGQLLSAALVMAGGVAVLTLTQFLFSTLSQTQEAYYERWRFADVFATARRVPNGVLEDVRAIPGVRSAEARIVQMVQIDVPDMVEPASATLVSIPDYGRPALNDLLIAEGRLVRPRRGDEALISEDFAEVHGLRPGDTLAAVINGRRQELRIVGLASSPEFTYVIAPGDFVPAPERFAVAWMSREALEIAFDRDGAFNDLVVSLSPGADETAVIDAIDLLLEPYGGAGAYARADQVSHAYLQGRIDSLKSAGQVLPTVFIVISAFMLNMMLARLVDTEREQIGLMKAFGYSDLMVAAHYVKLALIPAAVAIVIGLAAGVWLGELVAGVYAEWYSLPFMIKDVPPSTFALAIVVACGTALVGALSAARSAAALAPAAAMRPPAPARYRRGVLDLFGLGRALSPPTKIIIRNIERRPVRAGLTVLGVAGGMTLVIGTTFMTDSMTVMIEQQFAHAQRQDSTVAFTIERPERVLYDLAHLPGVTAVEGVRVAPARLVVGPRSERAGVTGLDPAPDLNRPVDVDGRPIFIPPEGLVLSAVLAELLDVRVGDVVTVEALDGRRPVFDVALSGIAEDYVGQAAYMRRDALNRALGEGPTVTGAHLALDEARRADFYAVIKGSPAIRNSTDRAETVAEVWELVSQAVVIVTVVYSIFAGVICLGVVYNTARISLSERGRELASLRVMGFTQREVSMVLLGEIGVLTLAALPLGAVMGVGLAFLVTNLFNEELIRLPHVVTPARVGFGAVLTAGFALAAALLVRRRIDRLDLIEVLKTRE